MKLGIYPPRPSPSEWVNELYGGATLENEDGWRAKLTVGNGVPMSVRPPSSEGPPRTGRSGTLTEEEVYTLLSSTRRRAVIQSLRQNGDGMFIRELSERIAETEIEGQPVTRADRKSVYISLHQSHLPLLDKRGIIEYDTQSKRVTLLEPATQLTNHMDLENLSSESRYALVSLGLSLVGIFLLLAADLGLLATSPRLSLRLAYVAFGLGAVISIVQLYRFGVISRWLAIDRDRIVPTGD